MSDQDFIAQLGKRVQGMISRDVSESVDSNSEQLNPPIDSTSSGSIDPEFCNLVDVFKNCDFNKSIQESQPIVTKEDVALIVESFDFSIMKELL